MKGQNNFWLQNAFLTCSWRFVRYDELEQLEFKLEKNLGFRNMQEKLEKYVFTDLCIEIAYILLYLF